ncbi:FAD-dependent monooxygenase [Solwaraspora sp. WMMB335]|uniref:FAD-dependent monooxygenase n=1 Tax=Solwaraspora sp. WMMB335 TaxID=3404118 RepID=UPI003B9582F7
MKAVICGAGIAGLALAQRLDTLGWTVTVLEQAPAPRAQGYMMDFFGPGYDAAARMGVLPAIRAYGYQVGELTYRDDRGRRRASLSYARFARMVDGQLVSIMRPDLETVLREALPDRVEVRYDARLTRIDQHPDRVEATAADGTVHRADLLVGADGIHSTVRRLAFGDEQRYLRHLGFHTAAWTFDDPEVRAAVGDDFALTDTTNRQLGCYVLRDDRVAVFAVHRTPDPALSADPQAALRREYAGLGWIAPRALAACPPAADIYYDQVAQIELPNWSDGRVVLVGDACQAVSLLAGQGASLAVAGAYLLAEQLARTDDDITAGLRGYQTLMRPLVAEKQQAARDGMAWFVPESPWRLRARRLALAAARLPGVDRLVASALVGKSSTLPRSQPATRRQDRTTR